MMIIIMIRILNIISYLHGYIPISFQKDAYFPKPIKIHYLPKMQKIMCFPKPCSQLYFPQKDL